MSIVGGHDKQEDDCADYLHFSVFAIVPPLLTVFAVRVMIMTRVSYKRIPDSLDCPISA